MRKIVSAEPVVSVACRRLPMTSVLLSLSVAACHGTVATDVTPPDLANPAKPYSASPVAVSGGLRFVQLEAGIAQTCGLTDDRAVYCWGSEGWWGVPGWSVGRTPSRIDAPLPFVAITVGDRHGCALTAAGAAYCWGSGAASGIVPADGAVPSLVATNVRFTRIRAGWGFTCALDAGGTAYCWGKNDHGQLGRGSSSTGPNAVPRPVDGNLEFQLLATGGMACGATDIAVYCWGATDGAYAAQPQLVAQVALTSLSVGSEHACGTNAAGALYVLGPKRRRATRRRDLQWFLVDSGPEPSRRAASDTEFGVRDCGRRVPQLRDIGLRPSPMLGLRGRRRGHRSHWTGICVDVCVPDRRRNHGRHRASQGPLQPHTYGCPGNHDLCNDRLRVRALLCIGGQWSGVLLGPTIASRRISVAILLLSSFARTLPASGR